MAGAIVGLISVFFVLFWILLWVSFMAFGIFLFVVWIVMLVDVVKRDFTKENDKIVWVLVIVLAGGIGAAVYYFVVKRPDKH